MDVGEGEGLSLGAGLSLTKLRCQEEKHLPFFIDDCPFVIGPDRSMAEPNEK